MMKKINVCQIVNTILGWLAIHWFKLNVHDEEDKCMSNSGWNSWVASHSLVQIECGLSDVNIKQLDRATSVGVVVVGDKDH
jgi:hypothetical protein